MALLSTHSPMDSRQFDCPTPSMATRQEAAERLAAECDSTAGTEGGPLLALLVEGAATVSSSVKGALSLTVPLAGSTAESIRAAIASHLHLDEEFAFHLTCSAQLLRDEHIAAAYCGASGTPSSSSIASVAPLLVLRLLPRHVLLGGKGGFGSLLRGATTKVGAKKTTNFSACRDLAGRRMRHVEAEQKIAEWNAQDHPEVNQQELQAKYKAIKEGRPLVAQECKWGATCKYRYSTCRREHPPDPNAVDDAAHGPQMTMPAAVGVSDLPKPVKMRHMQDAVMVGMQKSKKRARRADGEETKEANSDEEEEEDAMQDDDDEEDDVDISDDEQKEAAGEEPSPKRVHREGAAAAAAAAASSLGHDDWPAASSAAASSSASSSVFARSAYAASSSLPLFPSMPHREPELDAVEPEKAALGLAAVLQQVKKKQNAHAAASAAASSSVAAAASSTAAPASTVAAAGSFGSIDLASVASVDVLADSFPLAHLTAELTRVGLKAGGTLRQRAERLWMIRGTTIDQLPMKVRATTAASA